MQAALPCLIMAQANSSPAEKMPDGQTSTVELRGGTDAAMAPPVSYIEQVLLPMLQRLQGVKASIDLQRRGFFPKVCLIKRIQKHVLIARRVSTLSCWDVFAWKSKVACLQAVMLKDMFFVKRDAAMIKTIRLLLRIL